MVGVLILAIVMCLVLFGFACGFVLGVVYGVDRERADEAERLARRARYG